MVQRPWQKKSNLGLLNLEIFKEIKNYYHFHRLNEPNSILHDLSLIFISSRMLKWETDSSDGTSFPHKYKVKSEVVGFKTH